MDAVMIANESVKSTQRSKIQGLLYKLDIQKAYDYVNWEFLLLILQKWDLDLNGSNG